MADALVSFVVERIAESAIKEVTEQLLCAVRYVFGDADSELVRLTHFLEDAEARQGDNESVRKCIAEIREAACDLEDVIESYVPDSKRKGMTRFTCFGTSRKIKSEIKRINTSLSNLRSSLETFGIRQINTTNSFERDRIKLRRTYSQARERNVVGLGEDVMKLVRHLVTEDQKRVISVWGMGGLGKTTIAQQVYLHYIVRQHFECFAWVCVSQDFQCRDVLEEILTKLISPTDEQRREISRMKGYEIAQLLYTIQLERKCLIVLDDIWTCEAWDSLNVGFPHEEMKSKILLTTRNKQVALHADSFLHEARALNPDESWTLFEKIAIPIPGQDDSITYAHKKELGNEMLQSCRGLPLAIIVLAGVLSGKNTVPEWATVRDNVDLYLRRGTHLESKYEGTSWVLALSYDNLPKCLKLCFQYLGNFPDNYEIPVRRLSQLWMAEGLTPISSGSAESMEDASYIYLNELVERCMVQVVKHGSTGNIKTCCLHDLMRDLCRSKAKSENFLHVMNSSAATEIQAAPFNKVRRLAIHLDGIGHQFAPPSDERHAHLRSLLYFVRGHFFSDKNRKILRSVFKDFKFLKVLKFEDVKAEREVELPSILGNLVHLRFLSLRNSEIKRLPLSVVNLECLQTLDLRCVDWVCVKIPNVFRKMENLRHLYLPLNHRVTEKLSLATLKKLQTLVNISSQDCDLKDIVKLSNLRKLVVDAPRSTEFENLENSMKSGGITFDHLQSLSLMTGNGNGDIPMHILLSCPHLYKLQLYGRIKVFQQGHLCPNLSKLTLEETHLTGGQIKILQDLPKLRKLYLRMGAFKSETIVVSPGGFPQLEFLSLLGLCELKEWTVESGAMPSLCSLHIGYCWGMMAVPAGLQDIYSLKELTINRMYREFCNRLREGGQDFDKIRHVPSVTITNIRQT